MARKKKQRDEAGFEATGASPRARLTPVDVQEKVFRVSMRGYSEQDVDAFLDHVTEDLAAVHEENKRLHEQLEQGGGGMGTDAAATLAEAERRASDIVRQAREHAARLAGEAGRGAPAAATPTSYLVRERDFLQSLASLVQEHAETLKAEARKRPAASAPSPAAGGEAMAQPAPTPASAPVSPPPSPEEPRASEPPSPRAAVAGSADEPTQAHDPLLDQWEEGFSGGAEQQPYGEETFFGEPAEPGEPKGEPKGDPKSEEPSLKELFWGDE